MLSPSLCVERKALPDLVSSLASGRLYHQAQAMCTHYKCPVLLIEFEGERAWRLAPNSELGPDIDSRTTHSRLALLLLHFPKLRCEVHGGCCMHGRRATRPLPLAVGHWPALLWKEGRKDWQPVPAEPACMACMVWRLQHLAHIKKRA